MGPRPLILAPFALGVLAMIGGVAVHRTRGQRLLHATASLDAQRSLGRCVLDGQGPGSDLEGALRRRLALQPPGASPLASCVGEAVRLEAALTALQGVLLPPSGPLPARMLGQTRGLLQFPLDAPTLDLNRRLPELSGALAALQRDVCALAREEGVGASCEAPGAASGPPPPRVLLEQISPPSAVLWAASAGASEISVRVAAGPRSWELVSADGGASFVTTELPPASGDALVPRLLAGTAPRALWVARRDAEGQGSLVAVEQGKARLLAPVQLPAGVTPPPHGAPVLQVAGRWVTVGRGAEGVLLMYGDSLQKREDGPRGELLGAFQEGGARVLLKRQAASGFVDLVLALVPAEGAPWGKEVVTTVAYVRELGFDRGEERGCGLEDERYLSMVGVGGEDGALVAIGPRAVHAYRFHTSAGAGYELLCGSCPPMVLETRPDGLGIFVPVRRALTPARIDAPLGFERGRSERSAAGACTASEMAVVYEAGGGVWLQQREPGGWRFGPARVLAERDEHGEPGEPLLLGVKEKLVALWRRKAEGRWRIEGVEVGARGKSD
jgi:hypothetical protein